MSHRDTSGIRHLDQLRVGWDELEWKQGERHARARVSRLGHTYEPGWLGRTSAGGQSDYGWRVGEAGATGALRYQTAARGAAASYGLNRVRDQDAPHVGVDNLGQVLEVDHNAGEDADGSPLYDAAGLPISVPDDGVWYTLVAIYLLDPRDPGTLTLAAGSNTITGVGTQFLRQSADPTRSTAFRIATADTLNGNEGTYTFATITDDENATIVPAPPASEVGVRFRIVGQFFTGSPADPDIHNIAGVAWELRPRQTAPQPDGALIAFDVMRDTGATPNVQVIDRRRAQTFRRVDSHAERSYHLQRYAITSDQTIYSDGSLDGELHRTRYDVAITAGLTLASMSAAPSSGGADLAIGRDSSSCALLVAAEAGAGSVHVREWVPWLFPQLLGVGAWRNPGGGGGVTIPIGATELGTGFGLDLLQIPVDSGNSHLVFFAGADGLSQRSTTDNGKSWSGQTIIMPPPGPDRMLYPDACLTRFGRIVLVFGYRVDATNEVQLRYIFSDDYGASWDLNGGGGFTIMAVGGAEELRDPSIDEDDLGNLWISFTRINPPGANIGEIRLVRGGDLNDPVPVVDLEGWLIGPESPAVDPTWENNRTSLLACPGGQVVVLHNVHAGAPAPYAAALHVAASHVAEKTMLRTDLHALLETAGSGVSVMLEHLRFPDGRIMVIFQDQGLPAILRTYECELVALTRTHEWLGGL